MRYNDNKAKRGLAVYVSLFLLIVMGIVFSGYLSYQNFEQEFRRQAEHQISAIAELKVNDLVNWRKERLSDAQFLYHNPAFSTLVERYFENPGDVGERELLLNQLDHYKGSTQYDRVNLLDVNGIEKLSIPAVPDTVDANLAADATRSLRSGTVTFLDFHRDADGEIHLTILVPIFDKSNNTPLGVLALGINPQTYLYPYIQSWPIPSDTAETLLVRRDGEDVLFLNKLRFGRDTPLTLRFPLMNTDIPAVKAVLGQTGAVEGMDYRNEPVLADVRIVPDSPWFLVSKMDTAEVYAPLRERLWQTLLIIGLAIFVAGMGLALVWRQQRILFYRTQVETTEVLRESEERLRLAVSAGRMGTWDRNFLSGQLDWSVECKAMFGLAPDVEMNDERFMHALHPEDREATNLAVSEALEKQTDLDTEYRVIWPDGTIHWIAAHGHGYYNETGQAIHMAGITFDITARKQAEESLRESEALYRQAIEVANAVPYRQSYHVNGKTVDYDFIGEGIRQITGYGPEEFDENLWDSLIQESVLLDELAEHRWMEAIQRVRSGVNPVWKCEHRIRARDGSIHWVFEAAVELRNEHGVSHGSIGTFQDITERKQAEEALRESEALYRQAIEVANAVPYRQSYHANGKTVDYDFIGEGIRQITGYGPAEFNEALWDSLAQERFLLENLVEYSFDEAIERVRSGGDPVWKCNHRIRARDGSIRWVFEAAVELRDQNGISHGSIGMFQDITERKQAEDEIRKLNAELEQRVRERTVQLETTNKELEAFSYSVSHDLRAPLRGIDGWSQALLEDYQDKLDEQGQQYIARVRSETQRMGQLIDDMLKLSRLTRVEMIKKQVDLKNLAHIIIERLQKAEPLRKVDFNIQAGLIAEGDSRLLEVMLTNLLGNAFKFTAKRADASIEFGQTELEGQRVFFVRDNGSGFDMVYSQKLFGAFQRMHKASEFPGTGIGLATVQRIIHRHGGRIWADAEVGRGATFYFTLG